MQVTITLNFTPDEETEVAAILGCNIADLNNQLNTCATASLNEYLTMFRGQKVFKRGSDMLEYRLLLLIENTFNGEIPDERTVSSLFQTTLTESRSLIKSVISKFQYQLRPHIENTLKATLQRANRQNNTQDYTVVINSQNVVNELNKTLADIDGSLTAITKKKGSVSTFEIPPSSYNKLCANFKIQPNP
ncbi:hypothetical protein [Ewingella americana]|uniref:Uncharacterized protein n=2 Tax=Ewingella americana TaxID=41202 RepID=A0A085GPP1_EWIA3|nr:hypothetical protein [Ewingella americana]KAA8728135.1 hypothetical protein F4W05_11075 [Ewingella americana]KFC85686.1 hypothetical protein GEAM_0159 [Ewingella americana ATCC 33852]STQ46434.1 Uncharacterised protein [Ewingella americana]